MKPSVYNNYNSIYINNQWSLIPIIIRSRCGYNQQITIEHVFGNTILDHWTKQDRTLCMFNGHRFNRCKYKPLLTVCMNTIIGRYLLYFILASSLIYINIHGKTDKSFSNQTLLDVHKRICVSLFIRSEWLSVWEKWDTHSSNVINTFGCKSQKQILYSLLKKVFDVV